MKRNLSDLDRFLRLIVAALFAYLYFVGIMTGAPGIILVVLGGVALLTSVVGFCPLYRAFHLSTYRTQ